jgi:fructose-bisphosphate aldolase class I
MDGNHSLARCAEVTEEVLHKTFAEVRAQGVLLEGMLLKPNMVLPGQKAAVQDSVEAVAEATVNCLLRTVPAAVPGVAFLSGGQSAQLASARLNEMNIRFKSRMPWALAFSFSRAVQQPALDAWKGDAANVSVAQQALVLRTRANQAARRGDYKEA